MVATLSKNIDNDLSNNLPSQGSVRLLTVTEKQYASMQLLLGKPALQEKKVNAEQFLLF